MTGCNYPSLFRSLLGISGGENEENHNNTPAMNGSDTTKRQPDPNRFSKKVSGNLFSVSLLF